jgi:hypothetical protein
MLKKRFDKLEKHYIEIKENNIDSLENWIELREVRNELTYVYQNNS